MMSKYAGMFVMFFVLVALSGGNAWAQVLQAGDADQNLEINQLDLVLVQISAKYRTGIAAGWDEGDWDAAPGGSPGSPPTGDGFFTEQDIVALLYTGLYLTGPYDGVGPATPAPGPSAILAGGALGDGQTSAVYDADSGEVSVDPPLGVELTSLHLVSSSGIFDGAAGANLDGVFDVDVDTNILKADFGSGFGAISFGAVARTGLSESQVLADLSVTGSIVGGGSLGPVDLVADHLFSDGFESGYTWSWNQATDRASLPNLAVELVWHTPGDLDQQDGVTADLALHLLHPKDASWFLFPWDCYRDNPRPDWGAAGSPHDPQLMPSSGDDVRTRRVELATAQPGATYTVGVHLLDDAGFGVSVATVRLFSNGALVDELKSPVLEEDNFWMIWEVTSNAGGGFSIRTHNTVSSSPP